MLTSTVLILLSYFYRVYVIKGFPDSKLKFNYRQYKKCSG